MSGVLLSAARYHATRNGPRLCAESVGSCLNGDGHFATAREARQRSGELLEQVSAAELSAAKALALGRDAQSTERIVRSDNWGAALSDQVDEHIAATGVRPDHISLLLYWDEASIDDDSAHTRRYLFEAVPRHDESLGKYTNIYRLAWWNPADESAQHSIDDIYAREEGRDSRWARVADHLKWEAAFGESLPVVNFDRNDWSDAYSRREAMTSKNNAHSQSVLNSANVVDLPSLVRKLSDRHQQSLAVYEDSRSGPRSRRATTALDRYQRSLERKAQNIFLVIQAIENSVMGPYDSYDRGLGFYRLDDDRRTIVNESLSTTWVRGRHLQQLGLDSQRWLNGAWKGDIDSGGNTLTRQEAFARVVYSIDKGVPFESPMTFWTAAAPDGSRWELGLDVRSPEAGSHRVRHGAAANPNRPVDLATPGDAINGFAILHSLLEQRYGESSQWPPALQRDMSVLADIAEGHSVMRHSAQTARERMKKYGVGRD